MAIRPSDIDIDDLRVLAPAGSEVEIAAGQMLIERGHPGAGLYVVLEGSVVVEAPNRVRVLGRGSWIGELALRSTHGRRTARVRARTNLRVLAVARTEVERLSREHPALRRRIAGDPS